MSEHKKKMKELEEAIATAIDEAKAHANKYELSFNIYPAYGMGGTYTAEKEDWPINEYDLENFDGWYPSSQGC